MQLTPHFSLEELTISQTAERKSIDNTPSPKVLSALTYTAQQMELVRSLLGNSISISSGYRSPELNREVGGATNSQHVLGEAVDFTCAGFGNPRQVVQKIKESNIPFCQLILEFDRWTHISFSKSNSKREVLIIDNKGTRIFS